MTQYKNMIEVKTAVEDSGNVLASTLEELRDALNYTRLGVRVLGEISKALRGEGLGYYPTAVLDDNPYPRFGEQIRVYKRGSAVGEAIEAVLHPSNAGDELLRETAGSQSAETLAQIKALVCN